ncbi:L-aminopeptidase/D-esterase-like protein [Rhodothalassium salexigens DSM 2132]|uniref:L-aminopeptidase/D-esterase-like protein n=1 Tax=Rhodothalassium salexigens DSM 2132 TaxID=1188247 RepID=A0A4R2PL32_RHOSA|nr:P1 family peptidase [Rhodothalassium salexigens]MBB4211039.1 L-aminopeptidase/D-esterase-like protein [Rhodothalassium salexigens DSM 2132]MBK1637957.1 hypothetical protein [Rhodothalassium salexigens DSM 2132]TCP36303.1 L-aminopeptidase/D-esterase-like protein [Rhodothalassium salexigens DSM 2132]
MSQPPNQPPGRSPSQTPAKPATRFEIAPGAHDRLTDIAGLRVGQAADARARTGVTVILPDAPVAMGVDVRGGGPGTRETEMLRPDCLVEKVHALCLSGGSVFGLGAADALSHWLSERGVGLPVAARPVPGVPAAILFDLLNGGDKAWDRPPYGDLAIRAAEAAGVEVAQGRAGAGFGAQAGDRPGGIGTASAVAADGTAVGVLVAVNSFGSPTDAAGGPAADPAIIEFPKLALLGANTTLAAVATNLDLDKAQCRRLATMAHDGLARAIRPLHTPFDGDTVFALATGAKPLAGPRQETAPLALALAGTMAADALVRAVDKALAAAREAEAAPNA